MSQLQFSNISILDSAKENRKEVLEKNQILRKYVNKSHILRKTSDSYQNVRLNISVVVYFRPFIIILVSFRIAEIEPCFSFWEKEIEPCCFWLWFKFRNVKSRIEQMPFKEKFELGTYKPAIFLFRKFFVLNMPFEKNKKLKYLTIRL